MPSYRGVPPLIATDTSGSYPAHSGSPRYVVNMRDEYDGIAYHSRMDLLTSVESARTNDMRLTPQTLMAHPPTPRSAYPNRL
jgi:hypothetical protein